MTGKGYAIPEPIDPGELSCFRVYVPRHSWYLGAFWSAYQFFTTWIAWAKDPLHRGAAAAAVWRAAYDKALAEYNPERGCVVAVDDIRIHPLKPCVLQKQVNGAWVDVADFSCCGGGGASDPCLPPLRISGGQVQSYNPNTNTWENAAPEDTNPFDGAVADANVGVDNAQCIAARSAARYVHKVESVIAETAIGAAVFGEIGVALMSWIDMVLPGWIGWTLPFFNIFGTILLEEQASLQAKADENMIDEFVCIMFKHFDHNGRMSAAGATACADDFTSAAGEETEEPRIWRMIHAADIVSILGPSGMTNAGERMGMDDGNCDTCEWEAFLDFRVSPRAFVRSADQYGTLLGKWVEGSGWESIHRPVPPNGQEVGQLIIARTFETLTLTYVEANWILEEDNPDLNCEYVECWLPGVAGICAATNEPPGNYIRTWPGEATVSEIRAYGSPNFQNNWLLNGKVTLVSLKLRGRGPNPFILA